MKKIYAFRKSILLFALALFITNAFSQATLTPSGNVYVCTPPGSILLTANAPNAVSYLWSDGSTNQTLNVTISGQYYCTVTDVLNNALNSDTSNVTIVSLGFNLIGISHVTCSGNGNGSIEVVEIGRAHV